MNNTLQEIRLFDGDAPGSEDLELQEEYFEEPEPGAPVKKVIHKIKHPSLIPFPSPNPDGRCIMVIPGGGFIRLIMSKEGEEIARWLNKMGITVFILKHRMPGDGHKKGRLVPLQDAQRGLRVVRSLADKYGFDRNRVGVMGFSAGGHLASTLGTSSNREVYEPLDETDRISCRPDFLALIYPVISLHSYGSPDSGMPPHTDRRENGGVMEEFPTDTLITEETPPVFLTVSDDDKTTPSENCINFYLGLRKAGVPAELHIFRRGRHGFGLLSNRGAVSQWSVLFEKWVSEF